MTSIISEDDSGHWLFDKYEFNDGTRLYHDGGIISYCDQYMCLYY